MVKNIQEYLRHNRKKDDHKNRKYGNRNGTRNNSNINTDITQTYISLFHTSQTNGNSIPAQVQISRMGRQRGVNVVANKNDVSVTGFVISKQFSI